MNVRLEISDDFIQQIYWDAEGGRFKEAKIRIEKLIQERIDQRLEQINMLTNNVDKPSL